uniref:Uncharacterized protein n=1 Tax=Oncorhynchus kisutch TaxID=8019 RepID=A0A8C7I3K2_ONCKI
KEEVTVKRVSHFRLLTSVPCITVYVFPFSFRSVCPKWAEVQMQHTENSSVIVFIVCNSTHRLIKQLTTFEREAKVLKLFAKHINVEEQLKLEVTCIGEGTPGRLKGFNPSLALPALRFLLLNWKWRDQKPRMMVDIPDVQTDLLKLLDTGILKGCREGNTNTHPSISNWTSSVLTQTPQLL